MQAATLSHPAPVDTDPLTLSDLPQPTPAPGEVLLQVRACGVCRTDLHIVEGELPSRSPNITPGHQIVAEVLTPTSTHPAGTRVGVSWIGGTDGTCPFCTSNRENLCDNPTYTGYTRPGGYAQFVTVREDFLLPIPDELSDQAAAPLLCAGIIGFRSLRIAGVQPGMRVGLFGFGSSAQLALEVLKGWGCPVYVSTRGASRQQRARQMGAEWVGAEADTPPVPLEAAVTFAPAGDVVLAALRSLAKGATVAVNAIHLDRMPQFDYDALLWGERSIRSVTNMTREDGRDFLEVAARLKLNPEVTTFPLVEVNKALQTLKHDSTDRPLVILP